MMMGQERHTVEFHNFYYLVHSLLFESIRCHDILGFFPLHHLEMLEVHGHIRMLLFPGNDADVGQSFCMDSFYVTIAFHF